MNFSLECEHERRSWIAEVPRAACSLAYGAFLLLIAMQAEVLLSRHRWIDLKMGQFEPSASASHFHSLHEQ